MTGTYSNISPEIAGNDRRALLICALISFVIEGILLTIVGWHNHWLAHPPANTRLDESRFLQAEVYQIPEKAELSTHSATQAVQSHETALSREAGKGRVVRPGEKLLQEENQVKATTSPEPSSPPNHGPVAVFTPAPVLPFYLKDKELNASVVIEFLISARGFVSPRLISSSGNQELDAIAIATVNQWQFRPAEQEHKAIDSKVRLRIVFEVQ